MAPVADTRTGTDAYLEQRKVREDTALLVQQRDTLLREISQWQPVLYTIRAECAAHTDLPTLRNKINESISIHLLEKKDAIQAEINKKTADNEDIGIKNTLLLKKGDELDASVASKTTHLEGLKSEAAQWEQKAREAHQTHDNAMQKAQNELPPMLEALSQARNHLSGVQLEEEVLLQNRQAEEIRLATKSRDLAIYEARIREVAAQLNPPMQINL